MRRRRWNGWLGLLATVAVLLALNGAAARFMPTAQLDLTQDGLYTLSPGTRAVLAGLQQPVTLRLFYSRALGAQVPALGDYADHVRAMLRRYAALSHGRLRVIFYDPEPFSDVEEQAIAFGLQGVPLERGGAPLYFGLAGTNMLDGTRAIAFFDPARERFLEYDLTRTVLALADPARPVVGVMSSLPLDGDMQAAAQNLAGGDPWIAMTELRQAFDIRRIALDARTIDPHIQVLIVAHAQALAEPTLYAIDQYVMRGGRLIALVDPYSETQAGQPDASSDLEPLLRSWGVTYDPHFVVGDLQGAWRVRLESGGAAQATDYAPWFNIGRSGIAADDPATGDLDQVTVASAGALGKRAGATVGFTPLLQSSAQSALLPVQEVRDQPDPAAILAGFHPQGGPYVIAARIHGMLHSAFAAPPPGAATAYVPGTRTAADLVVIADSDLLADRFWTRVQGDGDAAEVTPFSDNGAFIVNLTGTLAGGDALLGLRGRRGLRRPFTRIDAMQAAADLRFQQTEQALQAHLATIRGQLDDLRTGRAGGGPAARAIVTTEQQQLIDQLTREVADTQGRLRRVQLDLRRGIDALQARLRLFDTAFVPVLLGLAAAGLALLRRRTRRAGPDR